MFALWLSVGRDFPGAFVKSGSMITVCCELLGIRNVGPGSLRGIGPRERIKLKRVLRNAKIDIHPAASTQGGTKPQLSLKIRKGISHLTPRQHTFDIVNGQGEHKTVSVEQYYLEQYQIRLQYNDLPLVETKPETFYPLELCSLSPGNKYIKRLSPVQTGKATDVQLLG